ncbi:MAG: hypothetical protein JJLCMIEE_01337 [Acidimicrobiales bacterium]|nr:MAG: hypothetical protein EDR02_06730 [Actinomycetota bacterium]MBV6508277.1 hypothetical protein [Acidimicrobiales bacterium]RIK07346.1 MAG: hypothetical protein DCC48_04525 [Acidobacteriota bacterium]
MDAGDFFGRLDQLSAADISRIAILLRDGERTVEGRVGHVRARAEVDRVLRATRRSRPARRSTHEAGLAVMEAARRLGGRVGRDDLTLVARSAEDVARAFEAGPPARAARLHLLLPWSAHGYSSAA